MFENVGDKTVREALVGLKQDLDAIQTGPFAQVALSLKTFLDKLDSGQIVITIQIKGEPKA